MGPYGGVNTLNMTDIQDIIANGFFDGNATIAGLIMFSAVMLLILLLIKKTDVAIVMMMPVSLIFGIMGILSTDLMVLLVAVAVLILAYRTRDMW